MLASTFAVLAIVGSAAAAPTAEPVFDPSTIRIPLIHRDTGRYSDAPPARNAWFLAQSLKLRGKYQNELTPEAKKAFLAHRDMELRKRNKETLVDYNVDSTYTGQVSFGTPPQNFDLCLDTGSTNLWVTDDHCTGNLCPKSHQFHASESSTFQDSGSSIEFEYGTGVVSGTNATDTVSLAGLTVSNQGFGRVNTVTVEAVHDPISGILGLAFERLSDTGAPWWINVMNSGKVKEKTMGFFMKRYQNVDGASAQERDGGSFTLGELDTSKISGSVNYVSIPDSNKDYWRIPFEKATVNGQTLSAANRASAIDTGTSLIGASTADCRDLYSKIPGSAAYINDPNMAGYWHFPCNTTVNMSFQFGGETYSISPEDFNLGAEYEGSSRCVGSVFTLDTGLGSPVRWVIGDTFLKNVYTVFRYEPTAIGFSKLA